MNEPIAVIGAGGFVGTQLVESLLLNGEAPVRAVVRAYRSFAGLARFGEAVDIQVADAEDPASLAAAIRGCSVAVNLTTGNPAGIVRSTRAIVDACRTAGVPRLVHMSSAVVYGDVAAPSIDDDAPPITGHWMPYARAKAAAEVMLRPRMPVPDCQIAVLRPGIVWGVRSPHTLDIASTLAQKRAYLVDGGVGVFNAIFIDNLVACIRACCDHPGDVTGFYNVADEETLTWREFYAALADHLDYDMTRILDVCGDRLPWTPRVVLDRLQSLPLCSSLYHWLKSWLPDAAKSRIKSLLAGNYNYEVTADEYATQPAVDHELWHLQRVRHKLPTAKFAAKFDFSPPISFEEGIRKTVGWLSFLGYNCPQASGTSNARAIS